MPGAGEPTELTVMAPGLLGPLPGTGHEALELPEPLPELAGLLSRARQIRRAPGSAEAGLADLLGVAGDELAAGALGYRHDLGALPESPVLRADPVHVQVSSSGLVQFDDAVLNVGAEEAEALAGAFDETFAGDGYRLVAATPARWYLCLPEALRLRTTPLTASLGADLGRVSPAGDDAARVQTLLTEAQMLFSQHPVNRDREQARRPAINSLWLWGEGALPAVSGGSWRAVWGDDGYLAALASAGGIPLEARPEGPEPVIAAGGRQLVYLEDALRPARYGELSAWFEAVRALEAEWFAPLAAARRQGRLAGLTVEPMAARGYRLGRPGWLERLCRTRPLERFLERAA